MKVALVGNTNNNNFALMRYFRDLGADAHLLLWSDDCRGANAHFSPRHDTWSMSAWDPFIHQTEIEHNAVTLIGDPRRLRLPVSTRRIAKAFSGYQAYVGCGYSPAILARCGIRLDVFYPYGIGVEGVGDGVTRERLKSGPRINRIALSYVRRLQIAAIGKARYCLNGEMSLTRQTLAEIGRESIALPVPMVYNREPNPSAAISPFLSNLLDTIPHNRLSIISHCRHLWVREPHYEDEQWQKRSKHNDWLLRGFARFIESGGGGVLLLTEYGQDVSASKRLVADLGIEAEVQWLPKMSRKELLCLISHCSIGVGEFGIDEGLLWGGTGWEVLAAGRPLMQTVNFTEDEHRATFGYGLPPILDVRCAEDVTRHLQECASSPERCDAIGARSKAWFNTNNGIKLAKKWLDLLHG